MLTYPVFEPHFPRDRWTLPAVLAHQAATRPDAPYLSWTDAGVVLTYKQIDELTDRVAQGLRKLGVAKGDRVVLFLPNCVEFVLTWFAAAKLGAVEVPVADTGKGGFLAHQFKIASPKLIVTTPALTHQLAELGDALAGAGVVLVDLEGEPGAPPAALPGLEVSSFAALKDNPAEPPGVAVYPRDPSTVLFTSGTTGASKGVVMSHSQFYFFAEEDVQLTNLTSDDVYMTSFPLIHGNAQFLTVYPSLIAGGRCVLYPRLSASDWIGRVRRSGATVTNTLGATMSFICAQPPSPDDRDNRLRCVYAAPLSPDLAPLFTKRFGVSNFVNGFGQTEISLPFMTLPGVPTPPNAIGVLVDQWFDVMIADPETDEPVPEGRSGELMIRPKAPGVICSEYLGMPEKTVETWRNLWFHTGDAVRRDAEGWYYFVDRVKDALRRRGENISSFEVESVVRSHPAVAECAVIAAKADEKGGEDEVMACVVLNGGATVDFPELIAWCDARMPYFMVPRYIEVFDGLPQTPSEKVQKKQLRDRGRTAQTWDRVKAGVKLGREK
jgi:crotonobetaine/carnitine-CoA ligase